VVVVSGVCGVVCGGVEEGRVWIVGMCLNYVWWGREVA
jgi:hypothetical protein